MSPPKAPQLPSYYNMKEDSRTLTDLMIQLRDQKMGHITSIKPHLESKLRLFHLIRHRSVYVDTYQLILTIYLTLRRFWRGFAAGLLHYNAFSFPEGFVCLRREVFGR